MIRTRLAALAVALAPSLRLGQGAPQDPVTAFVDVNVIPLDRNRVVERQTVVMQGEREVASACQVTRKS